MRMVLVGVVVALTGCGVTSRCKGAACDVPDAAVCGTCGGSTPVCDPTRAQCVSCTASGAGCRAPTAACDPAANGGLGACVACTPTAGCTSLNPICLLVDPPRCVECVRDEHCPVPGDVCNSVRHQCAPGPVLPDAGADAGADAGSDAGVDAGPDGGLADAGDPDAGVDPDAGLLDGGVCIVHAPPGQCGSECPPGFHCVGSSCVLNGGNGKVQVTLRWNTGEDVDLHVLEPVDGGAPCDVFYGNRNGSSCGARGSLDLDSNAGCSVDNVDIENIIYDPDAGAPSGVYEVRVDHWANCAPATVYVPFEVSARVGRQVFGYCGYFTPASAGWNDHGGANSGRTVLTFTVP